MATQIVCDKCGISLVDKERWYAGVSTDRHNASEVYDLCSTCAADVELSIGQKSTAPRPAQPELRLLFLVNVQVEDPLLGKGAGAHFLTEADTRILLNTAAECGHSTEKCRMNFNEGGLPFQATAYRIFNAATQTTVKF